MVLTSQDTTYKAKWMPAYLQPAERQILIELEPIFEFISIDVLQLYRGNDLFDDLTVYVPSKHYLRIK